MSPVLTAVPWGHFKQSPAPDSELIAPAGHAAQFSIPVSLYCPAGQGSEMKNIILRVDVKLHHNTISKHNILKTLGEKKLLTAGVFIPARLFSHATFFTFNHISCPVVSPLATFCNEKGWSLYRNQQYPIYTVITSLYLFASETQIVSGTLFFTLKIEV